MDGIRRTPYQYPLLGSVNELVGGLLGYMRDPRRTQQMQGLAGLLESTGIPKTVERLAYGEPLTNIRQANVPLLRPETAEALLTLAPVPPAAGRATMAVGRAGERLAERVVPQVMERGGMPAGLLEGMSSRTVSPLTVYHGSPARFERFDPTKIGSGEGAQAYGYGHYLAQTPIVAESYAFGLNNKKAAEQLKKLSNSNNIVDKATAARLFYDDSETLSKFIKSKNPNISKSEIDKIIQESKAKFNDVKQNYGNIYEVDLPDEQIAMMLDFDKPLMQQSKEIQALAKQYGLTDADHMGGDLIAAMDAKRPAGAELMRQAGVPGIRYLDQGSRRTGEGTSNFVVFPGGEDLLTILKRNGGLLGP